MILKCRNGMNEGWIYQEIDNFSYGWVETANAKDNYDSDNTYWIVDYKEFEKKKEIKVIYCMKENMCVKTIVTDKIVYILNSKGKTIDKI